MADVHNKAHLLLNTTCIEHIYTGHELNSGERIPRQLCWGVSEQNTKKVLDGIGFLVSFAARSFNLRLFRYLLIPYLFLDLPENVLSFHL